MKICFSIDLYLILKFAIELTFRILLNLINLKTVRKYDGYWTSSTLFGQVQYARWEGLTGILTNDWPMQATGRKAWDPSTKTTTI